MRNNFELSLETLEKLSTCTCIYFLEFEKNVVYVGQTINLLRRITEHINQRKKVFDNVTYIETCHDELDIVESKYIVLFNPIYNKTEQKHYQYLPSFEKTRRVCLMCGTPFYGASHGRYCSDACKAKAYRERKKRGARQDNSGNRICAHCGMSFTGALYMRYCKDTCKQAARRKRDKAREEKQAVIINATY